MIAPVRTIVEVARQPLGERCVGQRVRQVRCRAARRRLHDVARPADGDGGGGEQVLEDQVPADDPGDELAQRGVARRCRRCRRSGSSRRTRRSRGRRRRSRGRRSGTRGRRPGPACLAAAVPVSTKMPAPMMAPMPSSTRCPRVERAVQLVHRVRFVQLADRLGGEESLRHAVRPLRLRAVLRAGAGAGTRPAPRRPWACRRRRCRPGGIRRRRGCRCGRRPR